MQDLFTYPHTPGYRPTDTSFAAAAAMKPKAATLRDKCLYVLSPTMTFTADEIADIINETPFAVRPRMTELAKLGKVTDTGIRRKNESGRSAIVWQLA